MNRSHFLPALFMLLAACFAGCSRNQASETAAPQPGQAPVLKSQSPFAVGMVLETMNASTYTYVRVKTPAGEIWAAANKFNVKVGDKVAVPIDGPMENFKSPSLNRTFPVLYMTSRIFHQGDPDCPVQIP